MLKITTVLSVMVLFAFTTILHAEPLKKATGFVVEKVQTTSNTSGQISLDTEGWLYFSTKTKKELDKATVYFGKLDQDKQAVIYFTGETIVGVTSPKYGNFGTPPANTAPKLASKTIVGVLNGCSMHQGIMNCGINVKGKIYSLDDASTDSKLMEKLYEKSVIGKKVRVTGVLDDETINATQIQFVK